MLYKILTGKWTLCTYPTEKNCQSCSRFTSIMQFIFCRWIWFKIKIDAEKGIWKMDITCSFGLIHSTYQLFMSAMHTKTPSKETRELMFTRHGKHDWIFFPNFFSGKISSEAPRNKTLPTINRPVSMCVLWSDNIRLSLRKHDWCPWKVSTTTKKKTKNVRTKNP